MAPLFTSSAALVYICMQSSTVAAATAKKLQKQTDLAIKQVESDVTAGKHAVVNMLVQYATCSDMRALPRGMCTMRDMEACLVSPAWQQGKGRVCEQM